MFNNKYKLTKSIFSLVLLTSIPVNAYADDSLNVECEYSGDLACMIDPTYWNYDYNIVKVSTNNTCIRLTKDKFFDLINTSNNEVVIDDGGSTIIYDKKELLGKFEEAKLIYNENDEIIKKMVLNGGVTLIIVISTGLCMYHEGKMKKLK